MQLTERETAIRDEAIKFARKHKKRIAKRITDQSLFPPESDPVSVFMAGSPGAGKTEASIELLERLGAENLVLRVDPDDLRHEFAAYEGNNSWLFQPAVSILVEKIHDLALKQKQSFLLDGTMASYEMAEQNIQRSLKKGRIVQILYVYQEPDFAWDFVVAREKAEGRGIRPEDFIDQYFSARDSVNRLKNHFGGDIRVDLLLKNNEGGNRVYKANIERIDNYVAEKYTRADLEKMLLPR
ncbi:MAG TPA: Zeta toxin [Alcanivorax sp.]|jgi:predicted ABC-type ATPase|nr:Zeta toxin [Alcanivorax sp.]HAV67717.1 Zeta toxin [Alcanivorax sp.]|tara:strand:+ start:27898 stop:28617 length:720 start_codon:yes stop_codon:yes gene_type:complete